MKRPDFVVIGAMKAGSTTLYEDLYGHPQVFLGEKELGALLDPAVTSPHGRRRYDALFQGARPDQLVGDVSADYAKLPEAAGMAERAVELLGADLRVVYSVRNPVDRIVSQHHHELVRGIITEADIDRAVVEPNLVAFSRYAEQLEPFARLLGEQQVKVLCFERYMGDRVGGFVELATFLGLASPTTATNPTQAFNVAERNTVATGAIRRVLSSGPYRRLVRPLMSRGLRTALRHRILAAVPPRPAPPSESTVNHLFDVLAGDLAALAGTGFVMPDSWSREATLARYDALRARAADGSRT